MREARTRPAAHLRRHLGRLALAWLVLAASRALAQPAYLVEDVATDSVAQLPAFHNGWSFVARGDALYFFADDGVHGSELWRTDGTAAGTSMVRDVCPGQCRGTIGVELVLHDGYLYFAGSDGAHGRELWRSDGTFEGTELVADVAPGRRSSGPEWITPLGDRLVFSANGESGREPWVTDGTAAGTSQVMDIHPAGSSSPSSFVLWNGAAWFVADDGVHGVELWKTDGTAAGTELVKDARPGALGGFLADQSPLTRFWSLLPFGDRLLFQADDGIAGPELWATDGTAAGTARVADLEPGPGGSDPTWLIELAGKVYFQAAQAATGGELWRTDGTAAGTTLFREHEPGPAGSSLVPLVESGGKLFYVPATPDEGKELWVTDGSAGGTMLVEDVQPGTGGALTWNFAFGLLPFDGGVVFQADDGVHGAEPWVSDGTPTGTQLLGDVHPGPGGSFSPFFAPLIGGTLGDRAYFFAFDPDAGWELRSTAGVPGDLALVRDIDDQASSVPQTILFRLTELVDVAGTLFFRADDGTDGAELWASDGTEAGTRQVRDLEPGGLGGHPQDLTPLGDRLLFQGPGDGDDRWLWVSDGTLAGTVPIPGDGVQPLDPVALEHFDGAAYFSAESSGGARELWRSDGTNGGTRPFPEGAPLPAPSEIAAGETHLFIATASELWASGGDAASTEKLADLEVHDLAPVGPLTFFAGNDPASGWELWVSDGTPAGTGQVLDLVPGPDGAIPRFPPGTALPYPDGPGIVGVTSPPSAFFVADDGIHGAELWWSDGTETGTRFLGDLRPGPLGSEPRYLTALGSTLYFVANDGSHGDELWASDGTEAGTVLVADLEPGAGSSAPDSLTAVYGQLFFSAWRSEDGRELWRSDGTSEGTVRLQDLNDGPASSSPGFFTLSGGRLFFTASDGERGFELWALDAVAPSLVGTKEVDGDLRAGGRAVYTIALHNPGDFPQGDNPGDELVDELPEGLTVLAATADSGTITVDPDGRTLRWNGAVSAGDTVVVVIEAAIALDAEGILLENQARIAFDGDGSGDNETLGLTDDPEREGEDDPTAFVVGAPNPLEIPTLGPAASALLALLLAGAGYLLSRGR